MALAVAMIRVPLQALGSPAELLFARKLGALALDMHAADYGSIGIVHGFGTKLGTALAVAERATADNASIFGSYP